MGLFLLILMGLPCASWIRMSASFPSLGKFSAIISSNAFSASFSLSSSSSGTPIMWMLLHLVESLTSLSLFLLCVILFYLYCSAGFLSAPLSSRSPVHFSASSVLLFIPSNVLLILCEREGQRQITNGQGHREKQGPRWAGSQMWGSIPGPWGHDPSQRQRLNRLSHPGAPGVFSCCGWYLL